jgi:hypothetical protein
MNVADIETSDVIRVLKPIWSTEKETADQVKRLIRQSGALLLG